MDFFNEGLRRVSRGTTTWPLPDASNTVFPPRCNSRSQVKSPAHGPCQTGLLTMGTSSMLLLRPSSLFLWLNKRQGRCQLQVDH
jgi:hypothetical protein